MIALLVAAAVMTWILGHPLAVMLWPLCRLDIPLNLHTMFLQISLATMDLRHCPDLIKFKIAIEILEVALLPHLVLAKPGMVSQDTQEEPLLLRLPFQPLLMQIPGQDE